MISHHSDNPFRFYDARMHHGRIGYQQPFPSNEVVPALEGLNGQPRGGPGRGRPTRYVTKFVESMSPGWWKDDQANIVFQPFHVSSTLLHQDGYCVNVPLLAHPPQTRRWPPLPGPTSTATSTSHPAEHQNGRTWVHATSTTTMSTGLSIGALYQLTAHLPRRTARLPRQLLPCQLAVCLPCRLAGPPPHTVTSRNSSATSSGTSNTLPPPTLVPSGPPYQLYCNWPWRRPLMPRQHLQWPLRQPRVDACVASCIMSTSTLLVLCSYLPTAA